MVRSTPGQCDELERFQKRVDAITSFDPAADAAMSSSSIDGAFEQYTEKLADPGHREPLNMLRQYLWRLLASMLNARPRKADEGELAELQRENAQLKTRLKGCATRERELQNLVKSTQASLAREKKARGTSDAEPRGSFANAYFMDQPNNSDFPLLSIAKPDPKITELEEQVESLQSALATVESELAVAKAAALEAVSQKEYEMMQRSRVRHQIFPFPILKHVLFTSSLCLSVHYHCMYI